MVSIVRPVSPRPDLQAGWGAQKNPPVLQGGASGCDDLPDSQVGDTGLERFGFSAGNIPISGDGGAESGAVGARNAPVEVDLAQVTEAWPTLPEAVRASILAMVKAADGGEIG